MLDASRCLTADRAGESQAHGARTSDLGRGQRYCYGVSAPCFRGTILRYAGRSRSGKPLRYGPNRRHRGSLTETKHNCLARASPRCARKAQGKALVLLPAVMMGMPLPSSRSAFPGRPCTLFFGNERMLLFVLSFLLIKAELAYSPQKGSGPFRISLRKPGFKPLPQTCKLLV